jgi:hypothetical protein
VLPLTSPPQSSARPSSSECPTEPVPLQSLRNTDACHNSRRAGSPSPLTVAALHLWALQSDTLALAMLCALIGSSMWVNTATRLGLPVSTTHSIGASPSAALPPRHGIYSPPIRNEEQGHLWLG